MSIKIDYSKTRTIPNIPSLEILRRSLDIKSDLPYPYDHDMVFTGVTQDPHNPIPRILHMHPDVIFHYTKKIHLIASERLTFEGLFMVAPRITLKAKSIELISSDVKDEPITLIAAQTALVLDCHELFVNGAQLKCYDAPIDIKAERIRYANIDLDKLRASASFSKSCKFMEVEVIND